MSKLKEDTAKFQDGKELLNILSAIDGNASVSQRHMAAEIGMALGMVNTYVQRCVRKGWIKTQKIPARRYAYYLTPQGMAEKTRLVKKYMQSSLSLFREAKDQFDMLYTHFQKQGSDRVGIVGTGDLQSIGLLVAHLYSDMTVIPINAIHGTMGCDAYIVTDMDQPQETYDKLCTIVDVACVYPLPLLGIRGKEGLGNV